MKRTRKETGKARRVETPEREYFDLRWRILVAGAILAAGLALLLVRLYFEQIHAGEEHREKIARQSIRRIRIPALRGRILSSDLEVLADNHVSFDVVFYLEEMRQPGGARKTIDYALNVSRMLAARFDLPNPVTEEKLRKHMNNLPALPFTAFSGLSAEQLARFYEVASRYFGVGIETAVDRYYPKGRLAAALLGHVRQEDPAKAVDRAEFFRSYYQPDWIGISGMEQAFDTLPEEEDLRGLRGEPGYSIVQVDHLGFVRQALIDEVPPESGNNVVVTLDARAQRIAERLLAGRRGGMVVLDADTGEVLVLASSPGYDANDFLAPMSRETYQALLDDPGRPMLNRPLQGEYAPGSIIKPVIGLAITNAGIAPAETVVCDGSSVIGNSQIRCTGVHGAVNLQQALKVSCNVYFVEMGCRIGFDRIVESMRAAGIGRATGLEVGNRAGELPDREVYRRRNKVTWNAFATGLISIGQGAIAVTPLQMAVYTAALANGGKLMRPHLLKSVNDADGKVLYAVTPEVDGELAATAIGLAAVREGMRMVVDGGSGRAAANEAVALSGKTGTAQYGPRNNLKKNVWFTGFGERNGRRYAITVLIEDASAGGRDCAPLAAQFFMSYLGKPEDAPAPDDGALAPDELPALPDMEFTD